jgi:hypothetical protein
MINFNFNNNSTYFLKSILILTVLFIITKILKIPLVVTIVGFVLLVDVIVFMGLVIFEQINDKYRMRSWQKDNECLIKINEEKYECGRCGNRNIKEDDKYCTNCGCIFKNKEKLR